MIRESAVHLPDNIKLSDVQIAEIRKAFSMCDRDGDGFIDSKDLRIVLGAILQEQPSDADVAQLLSILDDDKSGVIEFQDFLNTMAKWLEEANAGMTSSQKRLLRIEDERQQVHDQIKGFFSQFKKNATIERVRQLLQSAKDRPAFHEFMQLDNMMLMPRKQEATAQQKLELLSFMKQAVQDFPALAAGMRSENPTVVLEACKAMAKLLSFVEVLDTIERQVFASSLVKIFELVVQSRIISDLARKAQLMLHHPIQLEAVKALTYIAPGPRIPSLAKTHPFHPSQMFFKRLLNEEGVLNTYLALLASPVPELREQVVLAIGTFASYDAPARDLVLQSNLVQAILQQVSNLVPVTMLRAISWTLSVCCGVTHALQQLPTWESIVGSLRALSLLFFNDDEEVLINVCAAFALVLPGVPQQNLCERLLVLLRHPSLQVRRAAICTLVEITKFDETQTNVLVSMGLVMLIADVLKVPESKLRTDACELLILISLKGHIAAIMRTEVPLLLTNLLASDEALRWKAVKVFKYMTRTSGSHLRVLAQAGLVGTLCSLLSNFKVYDQVLNTVYTYHGPSFNFDFIRDILNTLLNMLNGGIAEQEGRPGNAYAVLFDLSAIDRIHSLLKSIQESSPADVNAWRSQSQGDRSIEEKVMEILLKVKKGYDDNTPGTVTPVSVMIAEIWQKYFAVHGYQMVPNQSVLMLKLYYQNDVRVAEVNRTMTFAEIQQVVARKYGRPMQMAFKDEEEDSILIDGPASWERAMARFTALEQRNQGFGRLFISDKPGTAPLAPPIQQQVPLTAAPITVATTVAPLTATKPLSALSAKELEQFALTSVDIEETKRVQRAALFQMLSTNCSFTQEQLAQLHNTWAKFADAAGGVQMKEFVQGLKTIGVPEILVESSWALYVRPVVDTVQYQEFCCVLATMLKQSLDEKLMFIFWEFSQGRTFITTKDAEAIFSCILSAQGKVFIADALHQKLPSILNRTPEGGRLTLEDLKQLYLAQSLYV